MPWARSRSRPCGHCWRHKFAFKDKQLEGDLCPAQEHVTTEKGHGREETRTYLPLPDPEKLPGFMLWKGLKTIGLVISCCVRNGKETIEVRYDISSLAIDVKPFARAVRGHWAIENGCHWSLEMTFREDESRLRERRLRENFAPTGRRKHSELDSIRAIFGHEWMRSAPCYRIEFVIGSGLRSSCRKPASNSVTSIV
jgi:predicted transposase YbfD/YdcC